MNVNVAFFGNDENEKQRYIFFSYTKFHGIGQTQVILQKKKKNNGSSAPFLRTQQSDQRIVR